jgi:hypothetical protein
MDGYATGLMREATRAGRRRYTLGDTTSRALGLFLPIRFWVSSLSILVGFESVVCTLTATA